MNPLVSIVIPVYNCERYLGKTIDSVLNQDYKNIECIVVDDGSRDSSYEIARHYGSRIVLIRQSSQGQAVALNTGFASASGIYIGYLSSDDLIDSNLITSLVSCIPTLPGGIHVVFPRYRTIDENGRVLDEECPPYKDLSHMFESFRCNIGPGAIFSKEIIESISGWNSDYRQIPDFEFWLRAAQTASFYQLPRVMASFRVHGGSQTFAQSSFEKAEESIRLISELSWDWTRGIRLKRFVASAYVYSACLHIRSGRFLIGFSRYIRAFQFSILTAINFHTIRRIIRSMVAWVDLRKFS